MLQSRFGLRAEVADSIATEKFVSGSLGANAGAGGNFAVASAKISGGLTGGMSKRWTDNDVASVSREGARIQDALESWSSNHGWSENRDAFDRSVATSSRSDVSSRGSGISASATEAQSFSREARRFYEEASRLETRWSARDGEGVSGSLNTSDAFLAFARAEIASTPLVYRDFDPANATHWQSSDPQVASERDLLMSKYVNQVGANMRVEIEGHLAAPNANGLSRPAESSREGGRTNGATALSAAPMLDGVAGDRTLLGRTGDIRKEVSDAQDRGAHLIEQKRQNREADTAGAAAQPSAEGADHAREWSRATSRPKSKRNGAPID